MSVVPIEKTMALTEYLNTRSTSLVNSKESGVNFVHGKEEEEEVPESFKYVEPGKLAGIHITYFLRNKVRYIKSTD